MSLAKLHPPFLSKIQVMKENDKKRKQSLKQRQG